MNIITFGKYKGMPVTIFKRIRNMTKYIVVRYWDTYPDKVVTTCDTEEEAERIRKECLKHRKPMYNYLVKRRTSNE